jgi:hypothetical protein
MAKGKAGCGTSWSKTENKIWIEKPDVQRPLRRPRLDKCEDKHIHFLQFGWTTEKVSQWQCATSDECNGQGAGFRERNFNSLWHKYQNNCHKV